MQLITWSLLARGLQYGASVLYVTLGEIWIQRAGMLNLGTEGTMLVAAAVGFGATIETGSPIVGTVGAVVSGATYNALFGMLVIGRRANQPAGGLVMTILGFGVRSRHQGTVPGHHRPVYQSIHRAYPARQCRPRPDSGPGNRALAALESQGRRASP